MKDVMKEKSPTVLISCGETSGDLHASALVKELLGRYPHATILGFGGDCIRAAGAQLLFHFKDYAVMGFSGVVANLPKFLRLERSLKRKLAEGMDLFIPVDYPGLNLRLAAFAKKNGIPVLYYISPQVWAWGRGRIKKIEKAVDYMALILPFENSVYSGIDSEYVGHPFVEDHGIGLLPGSRAQEVKRILPILLEAVSSLSLRGEEDDFIVGMAPTIPVELYENLTSAAGFQVRLEPDSRTVMRKSKLLLIASGSATLQAALFETPLVIVYKVSWLNYLVARQLVKIRNIGLINIVLGEEVCKEFVQRDAVPQAIADAALGLLVDDKARQAMIDKFKGLREILAGKGGCRRVAEIAGDLMAKNSKLA
jgi:lipid-A-disaccharide synthase